MSNDDKILKIKEIINEVVEQYKNEYFPMSAFDEIYQPFINAVYEIEAIVGEKMTELTLVEKYHWLLKQVKQLREKENEILDQMDDVWWELSETEQHEIEVAMESEIEGAMERKKSSL